MFQHGFELSLISRSVGSGDGRGPRKWTTSTDLHVDLNIECFIQFTQVNKKYLEIERTKKNGRKPITLKIKHDKRGRVCSA